MGGQSRDVTITLRMRKTIVRMPSSLGLNVTQLTFPLQGLVSKPPSQMAQEGEVLGSQLHNGGIRALRSHGTTFPTPSPSFDIQFGPMVTRYAQESQGRR